MPSLLLGDAGPTAEAPTAAAAAATLEGQGSFSALAAEERWPLPLDNDRATNTAGAAASASAAAAPSAAPAAAALTPEQIALGEALAADEAAAEERRRRHAAAGPSGRAAPAGHDVAVDGDHDDDDDDGDFAGERRELLIYALPLTREKVAFLPVATFREEAPPPPPAAPEAAAARSGIGGFVKARVRAALDEASEAWEGLKAAEDGTFRHRLFKLVRRKKKSVAGRGGRGRGRGAEGQRGGWPRRLGGISSRGVRRARGRKKQQSLTPMIIHPHPSIRPSSPPPSHHRASGCSTLSPPRSG